MTTGTMILVLTTVGIIGIGTIIFVHFFIRNHEKKHLEKELLNIETQKNMLISSSILTELSKLDSLVNNDKLSKKRDEWRNRFNVIKDKEIPLITDRILEISALIEEKNFKESSYLIASTELDINYAKTKINILLDQIRVITLSEERNRTAVTKLKGIYREIVNKYNNSPDNYKGITESISKGLINIDKLFGAFESSMEKNEYEEVGKIVKGLNDLINNMKVVIEESPTILLLGVTVIPKKINDVKKYYEKMIKDGFNLEYLKLEYNIEASNLKLEDILSRLKSLDLEDSIFDLKTMADYFESLYGDFDKERISKKKYEDNIGFIGEKISRLNTIIKNIYKELGNIKETYEISEEDLLTIDKINKEIVVLKDEYKLISDRTRSKVTPYSKLEKECETALINTSKIEDNIEISLKSLSSLKEDELRAREQLSEIRSLLKKARDKIKEYNLPVIPSNFSIELSEAYDSIKQIVIELDRKPINIDTLNTRVDTSRDLVLKLYNTSNEAVKTAAMSEMAIVYGNRYRSTSKEVEVGLNNSKKLFLKGEYKKALEEILNTLNIVEPGIHKRLLSTYEE
ncbi:MAG: septation ring formation regulator EzrA [Bacilli bacterium]